MQKTVDAIRKAQDGASDTKLTAVIEKPVRIIRVSQREEIRLSLQTIIAKNGSKRDTVSARWFTKDGGQFVPERTGLSVKLDVLPSLIEGLQAAEREARAMGLLDKPEGPKASAAKVVH